MIVFLLKYMWLYFPLIWPLDDFSTLVIIFRVDKTTLVYKLFKSLRETVDERESKIGYFEYVHSFISWDLYLESTYKELPNRYFVTLKSYT